MKLERRPRFIKMFFGILIFITLIPTITMLLWNALMPEIFDLNAISFWQALGLLILSKILFSGFASLNRHSDKYHCHPHSERIKLFRDKMKSMTKEQRKAYFQRKTFGMPEKEERERSSEV